VLPDLDRHLGPAPADLLKQQSGPGLPDVLLLKNIFAEKNAKKLAFLTLNKVKLCKIMIITFGF
jgi:hypothetical protein